MEDKVAKLLEDQHSAAMITLRRDGTSHAARVGVALVGGKLWSSGTQTRLRTKHLRRDPRCTLFVFDTNPATSWRWLALETTVRLLDGPDAPQLNLQLFAVMQKDMPVAPGRVIWFGQEKTVEEFLQTMVEEQRLIYEFAVKRTYGLF